MGKPSREKGKRGERELAAKLRAMFQCDVRRGVQYRGGPDSPDVVGLEGVHIECKRKERLNVFGALCQAAEEAPDDAKPIVCHRASRQPWLVTLALEDLPAVIVLLEKQLRKV
jgi:Holliday junction resolvase